MDDQPALVEPAGGPPPPAATVGSTPTPGVDRGEHPQPARMPLRLAGGRGRTCPHCGRTDDHLHRRPPPASTAPPVRSVPRRMSRVPWNFGGGRLCVRLRRPPHLARRV